MRAALDDMALLNDEDLVGALDCREPVGDGYDRSSLDQSSPGRPGIRRSTWESSELVASSSSR